jgi:uncharacterized membrane protein
MHDFQRTTRRYILEDSTLHNHRCENLKSYILQNLRLEDGDTKKFRNVCNKTHSYMIPSPKNTSTLTLTAQIKRMTECHMKVSRLQITNTKLLLIIIEFRLCKQVTLHICYTSFYTKSS